MPEPKIAGRGPIKVQLEAGQRWWCACGESKNQPFCDGSHKSTAFTPLKFVIDQPKEAFLCTCKRTGNAPFCDGTHKKLE